MRFLENTLWVCGALLIHAIMSKGYVAAALIGQHRHNIVLPRIEWECATRDVRDNHCTAYEEMGK